MVSSNTTKYTGGGVQIPNKITLLGRRYNYAWQEKVRRIPTAVLAKGHCFIRVVYIYKF